MTKNIKLTTITAVVVMSIIGCGSSDSPSSGTIGTGYYVDSAIEGADYVCGTQKGTTDAEGKFIFDIGKDCSFSVADIPLRTIKADKLNNGVKIIEDEPKVARFL